MRISDCAWCFAYWLCLTLLPPRGPVWSAWLYVVLLVAQVALAADRARLLRKLGSHR